MSAARAEWAFRYTQLDVALVPLPPKSKAPEKPGWQDDENLIRNPAAARAHWSRRPHDNIGVCLEPSGLVSVDVDYPAGARQILGAEGIELDRLIQATPTIVGRNPRLGFRAPEAPLSRKSLVWPPRALGEKPVTVLEFRAGRCQDVWPPSIHPDTGKPYRWITPPREGFPPLTRELLALWLDFDAFKQRGLALCPWPDPRPARAAPPTRRAQPYSGPSVIREFNIAHEPAALLEAHGYERVGKGRWKSPNGHGVAGLVLLPDGKVFCHHQSDPLGDGLPHDAFDLFVTFDHGGDFRAAVKAAALALGMEARR